MRSSDQSIGNEMMEKIKLSIEWKTFELYEKEIEESVKTENPVDYYDETG